MGEGDGTVGGGRERMGPRRGRGGQKVNESQQECRLNEDKNLRSKIHKSSGAQSTDKETECWSTFPHRWGARGGSAATIWVAAVSRRM